MCIPFSVVPSINHKNSSNMLSIGLFLVFGTMAGWLNDWAAKISTDVAERITLNNKLAHFEMNENNSIHFVQLFLKLGWNSRNFLRTFSR